MDTKKNRIISSQEDKQIFSKRLNYLRCSKGLLVKDILEMLEKNHNIELKQPAYSLYENGKRYPNTGLIAALAKCLDSSVDYLIGSSNDPSPDIEKKTLKKMIEEGKVFFGDYQIPPEVWNEFYERFVEYKENDNR